MNRRRFNRESNQYEELATVFRVIAFGPLAENAVESIDKGTEVVLIGQFADDCYEKAGEMRRQIVLKRW